MTRMGRPPVDRPKSVQYGIRLDHDTNKKLLLYCKEHNITKGEAIRRGIHLLLGIK